MAIMHPPSVSAKVAFLPELYDGELLYGLLARYGAQMGYRSAAPSFFDLVGSHQQRPNHDFPFHLDAIAARIPSRFGIDAERLFEIHTLAPYYLACSPADTRKAALASARGGAGKVKRIVGAHAKPIGGITHLRFCPACLDAMDEADKELHWLRVHQLPIATHCAAHCEPLRISGVKAGAVRGYLYRATRARCPAHAPTVMPAGAQGGRSVLLDISRRAVAILEGGRPITDVLPVDDMASVSGSLTRIFMERGFELTPAKLDWPRLEEAIAPILDGVDDVHPDAQRAGRSQHGWLRHLLDTGRAVGTDAVVLALTILDRLPAAVPPFGDGPWECVNPLAGHHGERVVTSLRRQAARLTKVRGWFDCRCGCRFTRVRNADGTLGRVTIRSFGPLLETFVLERSRAGFSVKRTARELMIDSQMLVGMVGDAGIEHAWDAASFAERYRNVRRRAATRRPMSRAAGVTRPKGFHS